MAKVCYPKAPRQINIGAMLQMGDRRTQPEWRNIRARKEAEEPCTWGGERYPRQRKELTRTRWCIREDEQ
ncbi:hypothetical protein PISMIDRAFT_684410 [Pisolithus microcarpus 441]|uniref:Uncharacterized protein n=1 Tax=Pisolithus microcarpus 441 TaxID=765257 RepID=A0A0C9YNA4_9AGAM|nr:hypothetical protein PISMIDRAFT_684410 [Pisolithus microcarpus 441]